MASATPSHLPPRRSGNVAESNTQTSPLDSNNPHSTKYSLLSPTPQFTGKKSKPPPFRRAAQLKVTEILTNYRPKFPQPHFPLRLEDGLIGLPYGLASHSPDIFDEFNCLNLNITTPAGINSDSDRPVMVYIHGGGGFSGSNGDWWCDGASLVKRSIEIGKPIVAVAIKYVPNPFYLESANEMQKLPAVNTRIHRLRRTSH